MRTVKWLSLILGGLIALGVFLMLALWVLVNPNDYKPRIAAAVRQATGRDLQLAGDLKLSVFPWIALQLGPASLGNPPDFGAESQPFVSFTGASVRVRLLPLLSKRLEIGRVELDGLNLNLQKNARGVGNWQGFGREGDAAHPAGQSRAGETLGSIAGIKVTQARITYGQTTVQNLSLETGSMAAGGVTPVTVNLQLSQGPGASSATLDARFSVAADPAAQRYGIRALNMIAMVQRPGNAQPLRVTAALPSIDIDLAAQTLAATGFTLNVAGARIAGNAKATSIVDAPRASGDVTLSPLLLREYLPRLGMTVPRTRDPKALSTLSVSSSFDYADSTLHLGALRGNLDDTHVQGSAGMNLGTHAVAFDIAVDRLDVDRYLSPPGEPAPRAEPAPAAAGSSTESMPMNVNGNLRVTILHIAPLDLANVKVTVATENRVMRVFPLKAEVDGGLYSGDITLDQRATPMAVSMDEHLSGIDMGKLLARESKSIHMSGKGNVSLKASARGADSDALLRTLDGHLDAYVTGGAVEGIDLGFQLDRAQALLNRQVPGNARDTGRTPFDALKMSADIANGVAHTSDLTISSRVLKVTGQGSANLPAQTLNFELLADTLRKIGGTPLQIPVTVTGRMAAPEVRPNIEALARGQLKQKLQNVLQDKLKGLFGGS